jgi:hypothetical protein
LCGGKEIEMNVKAKMTISVDDGDLALIETDDMMEYLATSCAVATVDEGRKFDIVGVGSEIGVKGVPAYVKDIAVKSSVVEVRWRKDIKSFMVRRSSTAPWADIVTVDGLDVVNKPRPHTDAELQEVYDRGRHAMSDYATKVAEKVFDGESADELELDAGDYNCAELQRAYNRGLEAGGKLSQFFLDNFGEVAKVVEPK